MKKIYSEVLFGKVSDDTNVSRSDRLLSRQQLIAFVKCGVYFSGVDFRYRVISNSRLRNVGWIRGELDG